MMYPTPRIAFTLQPATPMKFIFLRIKEIYTSTLLYSASLSKPQIFSAICSRVSTRPGLRMKYSVS